MTRRAAPAARPWVSVGIPTYGAAPYLTQAVESVLGQTFDDWTLTVSENGPGGGEIERAMQRYLCDRRVRFRPTGRNLGAARNWSSLLTISRAPYVALLNDDDLWDADFLARRVRFLEEHPECGFVFSEFRLIDEQGCEIGAATVPLGEGVHAPETMVPLLYEGNVIGPPTLLLRREMVETVNPFFDRTLAMFDYEFWFRLVVRFPVGFLDVRDCAYRVHGGALSARPRHDYDERQWIRLAERLEELADEQGLGFLIPGAVRRRRRAFYELAAAVDALEARRLRASARLFAAGLRRDPPVLSDRRVWAALFHRLRARSRGLRHSLGERFARVGRRLKR